MKAALLFCLAALPAAVDALGEFHAEEVKTTCPTLVPLRLNQTNTAGSLMNTGTVAVLDSDYQGSEKPAVIVVQEWWGLNEEHIKKAQKLAESGFQGFEAIGVDKTFYPYDADVANAAWGSLFDFFEKYL